MFLCAAYRFVMITLLSGSLLASASALPGNHDTLRAWDPFFAPTPTSDDQKHDGDTIDNQWRLTQWAAGDLEIYATPEHFDKTPAPVLHLQIAPWESQHQMVLATLLRGYAPTLGQGPPRFPLSLSVIRLLI